MIDKKQVEELIKERIAEHDPDLFVVSLSISPSNVISVELDKNQGYVSIKDCIQVSRNIEHNLDRETEDFELNVSSAGLDKGLRVLPQYLKHLNRMVDLLLKDGTTLSGTLLAADEEKISIRHEYIERAEGKKKKEVIVEDLTFSMNDIKETKLVITFK